MKKQKQKKVVGFAMEKVIEARKSGHFTRSKTWGNSNQYNRRKQGRKIHNPE